MSARRLRGLLRRLAAGGLLLLAAAAGPTAAAGPGGYLTHVVVAGDTLASIGAQYLRDPRRWRELQPLNGIVDPQALVPGGTVHIPARLLRPAAVGARVEFVRGQGVVSHPGGAPRADAAPAPLSAGASLAEGARIQVPEDGYLRLRLADGSIVRVLAGSDVELKRLRRRNNATSFESVVDVKKGKVESEVSRQPAGRVFEIHAPGAVASVRGTRFDVSVAGDGRVGTAVSEGEVALRTPATARRARSRAARLGAGQGAVVTAGQIGSPRVLPPAPDLSALAERYEDAGMLRLDLGAASGAHQVRIARDASFAQVLRNGVTQAGRLEWPALEDGVYTVGVRALDADGLAGAEARREIRVHARPVPPLYQYPPPGGQVVADGAALVCSEVAGVAWVHVQVASRPDFASPEIDEPRLARCHVGLAMLPPGEYHWRVASVRDDGSATGDHGPFAPAQRFAVVAAPQVGAIEVADAGETPTLHWAAAAAGQRFRGQVASDAAFQRIVLQAELPTPQWTLEGLPQGLYYVRLRVVDAGDATGPWAPARRVRVGGTLQSGTGGRVTSSDGEPVLRP